MISLLLLYFFYFFRQVITNLLPLAFFSVQLFFLLFSDLYPLFHECQSLNFSFEKVFHCIGLRDVKIESTQLHGQDWSAHLIKWSDQITNIWGLALPPLVTNTWRWTYVYRLVPKRDAGRGGGRVTTLFSRKGKDTSDTCNNSLVKYLSTSVSSDIVLASALYYLNTHSSANVRGRKWRNKLPH